MIRRSSIVERETKETKVKIRIDLDGEGYSEINTSYPFLDHMLSLFSYHGFFDLEVLAKGDIEVDYHHLVEDVGICLGKALRKALGNKKGIRRYGNCFIPMDETLTQVVIDISGRPLFIFNLFPKVKKESPELEVFKEFFRGFSSHSGITLHINLYYGDNFHHLMEAVFKSFALSLDEATSLDERRKEIPSTKKRID